MAIPTAWIRALISVPSGAGLHPLARPGVRVALTLVANALGRLAERPSRVPWLRLGLGLLLSVGAFALVAPPSVLGEGSADLEANGGKRALTEWRTSLYGNLLPRRTLFKVFAQAGEEIALGSSGVGSEPGTSSCGHPGRSAHP